MGLRTYVVTGKGSVVGQHLLKFRQNTSCATADLANGTGFNFKVTRQHRNNPTRLEGRVLHVPCAPGFGEVRAVCVDAFAGRRGVHFVSTTPLENSGSKRRRLTGIA